MKGQSFVWGNNQHVSWLRRTNMVDSLTKRKYITVINGVVKNAKLHMRKII